MIRAVIASACSVPAVQLLKMGAISTAVGMEHAKKPDVTNGKGVRAKYALKLLETTPYIHIAGSIRTSI